MKDDLKYKLRNVFSRNVFAFSTRQGKLEISGDENNSPHKESEVILNITDDFTIAKNLLCVEDFVKEIIKYGENNKINSTDKKIIYFFKNDKFMHDKLVAYSQFEFIDLIDEHYRLHTLNPFVELFIINLKVTIARLIIPYRNPIVNSKISLEESVLLYSNAKIDLFDYEYNKFYNFDAIVNRFIYSIVAGANSPAFKKAINNYERVLNQNYASLCKYINNLCDLPYQKLLVLRIDLGYEMMLPYPDQKDKVIKRVTDKYKMANKDFNDFFKKRQSNPIFKYLVGYVWKLKYGVTKGFCYHLILFYDGSKVLNPLNKAKAIGEHWKAVATGGGLYYSYAYAKDSNDHNSLGVGLIDKKNNPTMRKNLIEAAEHLTKADYFARITSDDIGRTLGKGVVKKVKKTIKGDKTRKK